MFSTPLLLDIPCPLCKTDKNGCKSINPICPFGHQNQQANIIDLSISAEQEIQIQGQQKQIDLIENKKDIQKEKVKQIQQTSIFSDPRQLDINTQTREHYFSLILKESQRIFPDQQRAFNEAWNLEQALYDSIQDSSFYITYCTSALQTLREQKPQ